VPFLSAIVIIFIFIIIITAAAADVMLMEIPESKSISMMQKALFVVSK